nr:RNA-directed DNA polymerase, eukaryota [Tanacetum cinerariifolium]
RRVMELSASKTVGAEECVRLLEGVVLSLRRRSSWEFDNEETFTVRSVRDSLDVMRLPVAAMATRWCNILPIKLASYESESGGG